MSCGKCVTVMKLTSQETSQLRLMLKPNPAWRILSPAPPQHSTFCRKGAHFLERNLFPCRSSRQLALQLSSSVRKSTLICDVLNIGGDLS